jgi:DNA-binding beta-propeller fold protein YncE
VERVGGRSGSAPGEIDAPGGAAAVDGSLFVADFYNHRVDVLGEKSPRTVGRGGRVLSGRLHYPTDIAVGQDSLVYVADAYNHRVQVFRPDGTFVRKWGGPLGLGGRGGLRGWFRVATGIDVAGDTVYVTDFENDRVQIFTARGRYRGQLSDSLRRPTDSAMGGRGELYVVDFGHDRIVRYRRVDG